ncbi:MAG: hypothetical protein ACI9CD_001058, partial [Candidatus Deianiraeaceae bacterium]
EDALKTNEKSDLEHYMAGVDKIVSNRNPSF